MANLQRIECLNPVFASGLPHNRSMTRDTNFQLDLSDIPTTSGIYRIINKTTGKSYVGSSVNMRARLAGHARSLHSGTHNIKLQRSWNKHGGQVFEAEVLELVTDWDLLLERELVHILELNAVANGYNIVEECAKNRRGMVSSEEHKLRISQALRGKPKSEEARRNMSEAAKRRANSPQGREALRIRARGRTPSEETRRKLSEASKRNNAKIEWTPERRAEHAQKVRVAKAAAKAARQEELSNGQTHEDQIK